MRLNVYIIIISVACNARTVASAVKKGFNNPLMGASLTAAKPMSQVCACYV